MFRTMARIDRSSRQVRKSLARVSMSVAPLILEKKSAYREIGPTTGMIATPSRTTTSRVLSRGRPSFASTASGDSLVRSAMARITPSDSSVIAHGLSRTQSAALMRPPLDFWP
jgi:hypothetical protein